MFNLFISTLSTISTDTVSKIVDAITAEYQKTNDDDLIGDYGNHAEQIAYTIVEAIITEFIQQANAGCTNFTLDEFEIDLQDDWESIYSFGEPVDDEFIAYVGSWLTDPKQLSLWANLFDMPFQEIKAMFSSLFPEGKEPGFIMLHMPSLRVMLMEGTIRFAGGTAEDVEWSGEKLPYVSAGGSMFNEHEFITADYPVVKYGDRILLLEPMPKYEWIPIHAEVSIGRLNREAKHWMETENAA